MPFKYLIVLLTIPLAAYAQAQSSNSIYTQRVIPLLRSGSNSCAACHFQGIEFKKFFTEDPQATFEHLRSLGWIDARDPSNSKILDFIGRHTERETEHQQAARVAEHDAIYAWIAAVCKNPLVSEAPLVIPRDLELDQRLIAHTRADQLEYRFVAAIWSQLERCANCHSPDRNQRQVEEHGEQMSWIVPRSPMRTLELLTERQLITLDAPDSSPLRTKPAGLAEHGAGIKFPIDGETDSQWVAFLRDYAKTVRGSYTSSAELPENNFTHRWRSGLHLRVTGLPVAWYGKIVIVHLHPIALAGEPAPPPIAFGESYVSHERDYWSNSLELLDSRERVPSEDVTKAMQIKEVMPSGRYELRIRPTGSRKYFTFILDAPWTSGHAGALKLSFDELQEGRLIP
jgi:hypothetical protein